MLVDCTFCEKARESARAEQLRAEEAERRVEDLHRHIAEQEHLGRELRESEEHLRQVAFHDPLTGLPNRTLFANRLKVIIERAKGLEGYSFAVLFIDLDRFRNINESLGHNCGDQLLITVAHRLQGCVKGTDIVARFGSDEFAILLNGVREPHQAIRVAKKIQQQLGVPTKLNNHEAFTTASIGIALSTSGYEGPEDVLRDADSAMYRAKDAGRARYEVFDKAMHSRAVSLLTLENELRQAVERGEFCNYYQPIISLKDDQLAGFEALVRWQHPTRGMVSPAEFIPVAENTGFILPIGLCVLEEACCQLREWQRLSRANSDLTMSVNLSGKQLAQPDLIDQVEHILLKADLDPRCLKLEITESVVMEDAEKAINVFKLLRALGVRLSIDDFGTGYSSLSYLHRFPVDTLKIDRSFVSRMNQDKENYEIVRTIATLAQNLGMEIVAEGIEMITQRDLLKALKCNYGQGYLFSRPMSAADAEVFLKNKQRRKSRDFAAQKINRLEGDGQIGSSLLM